MPKLYYIAKDKQGKKIANSEECLNQEELLGRLRARGWIVISVEPESKRTETKNKAQNQKRLSKRQHYSITSFDLSIFCRQLATLLGAGVTILEALIIISKQISSRKFAIVLLDIRKKMEEGLSLHEAMAKNSAVFSPLWVNLVESGEASGNLAIVLSRLAGYLERNAQFKNKVISALIYPIILFLVGMGALIFLTVKIIPVFADLFEGFNMDLPQVTEILIVVSGFVRKYLLVMMGGITILIFAFKAYIKTPEGRRRYENFLMKLPVFGEFFRNLVIERFSSEMTTLIESGVPILYALEITERSVDNTVMAEIIRGIKEEVRQGRSLSSPMEKNGFFEPMIVQMISIGEEVGDLSGMFSKIHTFYQESVETLLSRFTLMFEPIMLVFIGAIVGIMVVGMFLPIFKISQIGMY